MPNGLKEDSLLNDLKTMKRGINGMQLSIIQKKLFVGMKGNLKIVTFCVFTY